MMTIGAHALRVMTMPFCLSAICIILGDALIGMGIGYVSAINSFIRQILVLLPLAYLLMHPAGLYGIWYAFVISEFVSLMVTLILFQKLWRKKSPPGMSSLQNEQKCILTSRTMAGCIWL